MPKQNCLWLYITNDEYELPIYVTDTAAELARKVGTTENAVRSGVSHFEKKEHYYCRYRMVYVE